MFFVFIVCMIVCWFVVVSIVGFLFYIFVSVFRVSSSRRFNFFVFVIVWLFFLGVFILVSFLDICIMFMFFLFFVNMMLNLWFIDFIAYSTRNDTRRFASARRSDVFDLCVNVLFVFDLLWWLRCGVMILVSVSVFLMLGGVCECENCCESG